MPLTLYGVLRSRASRPAWLLRELGVPYTAVPVIQSYRLPDPAAPDAPLNTASAAFLAVNPNGQIPTLDDDGLVLHESLAITLYLARKHGGPLAPRDAREDAMVTMWTLWAAGVEPHGMAILYNRPAAPPNRAPATADPREADRGEAALARPFAALGAALRHGGGHLVGGRFTVADLNVAEVLRYAQAATTLFAAHPDVAAWIAACQARPAFRAMMEARNAEVA